MSITHAPLAETKTAWTHPLAGPAAELALSGGKGASLARMVEAGLPVPEGFVVGTAAYRRFVEAGDLQPIIEPALAEIDAAVPGRLETAARMIGVAFAQARMPREIEAAILAAYAKLPGEDPAVAVRSSATAEDLPELSFAGQQETFLNVRGPEALLEAVRRCWASLWTPRAIGYRARHEVPGEGVAMAVVVQPLVPAESSGILFTASPVDGRRDQMVINASWGLGEAIVGGRVTPDTLVVDASRGEVLSRETADKAVMTVRTEAGAEERAVPSELRERAVLDDAAAAELARLGARVEALFGRPMDIEWARAEGRFTLLQARPITALPDPVATPASAEDEVWEPPEPGMKLIRRQVVEHMPGPLSPLFDELYLRQGLDQSIDVFLEDFGMGDFEVERYIPRPFFVTARGFAYARMDYDLGSPLRLAGALWQILPAYFKMLPTLLRHAVERWRDEKVPAYQAVIDRWATLDPAEASDEELWGGMHALSEADAIYWFEVSIILGLTKVTDDLLNRSLRRLGEARGLSSGQFLRGFPSRTMDAQISLEAVAETLRGEPALRALVARTAPAELVDALERQPEAAGALAALREHVATYGHQIYTLDFAEPTQGEDLLPILVSLAALVEQPRDSRARLAELAGEREALIASTAASFGPFRRWRFRKLLGWAQKYAPYRESALFYVGAGWPALRRLARELGRRLAEGGAIAEADDLYYLRIAELEAALRARAAGDPLPDYRGRVEERRALREARKALTPPAKIPDLPYKIGPIDMAIFEPQKRQAEVDGALRGFGVSPGVVTAPALVLRSPADFEKMRPGHVLVCPTTTPAWTPLFAQAAGLVTEIGSILAHGSIVAREYGIPAVMGLERATERIRDGQVITVDGDRGLVTVDETSAG